MSAGLNVGIPINLGIPGLPPLALSGGQSSTGHTMFEIPFNYDNSGWNVNIKGQGNQSAQGNGGTGGGGLGGLPGNWLIYGAIGLGVYLMTR